MTQEVQVPGVGTLQFPDGMSQANMAAAIQKNYPQIHGQSSQTPQEPSLVDHALNVLKGGANVSLGIPEALAHFASGIAAQPVAGIAGMLAASVES